MWGPTRPLRRLLRSFLERWALGCQEWPLPAALQGAGLHFQGQVGVPTSLEGAQELARQPLD